MSAKSSPIDSKQMAATGLKIEEEETAAPVRPGDARNWSYGEQSWKRHRQLELSEHANLWAQRRKPTCEACEFSFVTRYGLSGQVGLQPHDVRSPLETEPSPEFESSALVLLCANCHEAIHVRSPWLGKDSLNRLVVDGVDAPKQTGPFHRWDDTKARPKVTDLSVPLSRYFRKRAADPKNSWPYHPRSNDLGIFIHQQFLRDLVSSSHAIESAFADGLVACDINRAMGAPQGATKKVDLVVGRPSDELGRAEVGEPIRKAKIKKVLLTLEVKACMTEHGKSIPRLVDELRSSLRAAREEAPNTIAAAILIVNTSARFTSPLNLPGPNMHEQPTAARKLISGVLSKLRGQPEQYDLIAVVPIELDNEKKADPCLSSDWADTDTAYSEVMHRVGGMLENELKC